MIQKAADRRLNPADPAPKSRKPRARRGDDTKALLLAPHEAGYSATHGRRDPDTGSGTRAGWPPCAAEPLDLRPHRGGAGGGRLHVLAGHPAGRHLAALDGAGDLHRGGRHRHPRRLLRPQVRRSEEHTSELQSRPHLVCRLLLEKKKKKNKTHENTKKKKKNKQKKEKLYKK